MKKLLAIVVLFSLTSCGKEAEKKVAQKSLLPKQTIQTLNVRNIKIDSAKMRSMTFLMYPLPEDLNGFTYEVGESSKESWDTVLADIPYADRLTIEIDESQSNFDKVMNMVTNIMSIGESRDNAFKKMVPLQRENDELSAIIIEKKAGFKSKLEAFTCFYKDRPARGANYECQSTRSRDARRKKIARKCRDLNKFTFTFTNIDEQTAFDTFKAECPVEERALKAELKPLQERSDELSESIEVYDNLRTAGESLVLEMLQNAEKHNGKKVYVATGATKEKVDDDEAMSSITFGPDNQTITDMTLLVDFGLNFDYVITGYQEYSMNNGKIKNVSFKTLSNNVTLLTFDLHATKTKELEDGSMADETMFVVSAELSMTNQDYMDIRFVGETKITYPNGKRARGAMKLEFDIIR